LAWAISEYLLERIKARTLFATHYHELAELKHPHLVDLTLEVLENAGEIVFAKKVRAGVARSSYGLHVARLAGIPGEALARARQIQDELLRHQGLAGGEGKISAPPKPAPQQASFFNDSELIIQEIKSMRLNDVTPLEALNKIAMWNKVLKIKNDN
jgi:DNA mismatch repair protein MutS